MNDIENAVPALSYLDLVEKNNLLLSQLVDILSTISIPPEVQPFPNYMWVQNLPGRMFTDSLQLKVETYEKGLTASIQSQSGIVLWRHFWEWKTT